MNSENRRHKFYNTARAITFRTAGLNAKTPDLTEPSQNEAKINNYYALLAEKQVTPADNIETHQLLDLRIKTVFREVQPLLNLSNKKSARETHTHHRTQR